MEEWNDRFNELNRWMEDLKDMYHYPDEWNECYYNNPRYVCNMPFSKENFNLLYENLIDRQIKLIEEKQELLSNKSTNILTEYMFITIRPQPKKNISVKWLYDKTMKLLKSKCVSDFLLVFEQSSKTVSNAGEGLHVHFIIKSKYRKYCELRKQLRTTYFDCSDYLDTAINIKNCKTIHDVEKRKKYMLGQKEGLEKQHKQEIDKYFRQRWNIQDFYGNINIG